MRKFALCVNMLCMCEYVCMCSVCVSRSNQVCSSYKVVEASGLLPWLAMAPAREYYVPRANVKVEEIICKSYCIQYVCKRLLAYATRRICKLHNNQN